MTALDHSPPLAQSYVGLAVPSSNPRPQVLIVDDDPDAWELAGPRPSCRRYGGRDFACSSGIPVIRATRKTHVPDHQRTIDRAWLPRFPTETCRRKYLCSDHIRYRMRRHPDVRQSDAERRDRLLEQTVPRS